MQKVSLDTWIQLLGMLGLLGGLIFVGLEMQQSQRIAVASQQQDRAAITVDVVNAFYEVDVDFQSTYFERNFEYVEKDFSKRVREIYYDKKNKKTIYGTTTAEERKELEEEGIDLLSIPWVEKNN